jgi:hypothetical protein
MSSVDIESGTEGPAHDPYGWMEITVTRPNGVNVTIHDGLMCWLRTPEGVQVEFREDDPERLVRIFERYAGVTPDVAVRAYQRYTTMCRKCGGRSQEAVAGFPGETIYLCCNCNAVVNTTFNESAII